jgi:subtilisin family serine protease
MKKIKTKVLIASLLIPLINLMAVNPEDSVKYVNWQNKDPKLDKTMGVSVEKAYNELLQGKESKTVLVAVIDGGIDVDHEDLKDVIWGKRR